MVIQIDILDLVPNSKEACHLYRFLKTKESMTYRHVISKGLHLYQHQNEWVWINISHTLWLNFETTQKAPIRSFYIQGEFSGRGGSSEVSESVGRLVLMDCRKTCFVRWGSKSVIKQFKLSHTSAKEDLENRRQEVKMLKTLQLGGKNFQEKLDPVMLMMHKAKGVNLFEYLAHESYQVTFDNALALTVAVLRAYREQIYERRLLHCDIKLENMVLHINERSRVFHVTFIDYAYALHLPEGETKAKYSEIRGSKSYLDPRLYQQAMSDSKDGIEYDIDSDLWALNLVIFEIWGSQTILDNEDCVPNEINDKANNFDELGVILLMHLHNHYYHHEVANKDYRNVDKRIKALMTASMSVSVESRLSFEETLARWEAIAADLLLEKTIPAKRHDYQKERKDFIAEILNEFQKNHYGKVQPMVEERKAKLAALLKPERKLSNLDAVKQGAWIEGLRLFARPVEKKSTKQVLRPSFSQGH